MQSLERPCADVLTPQDLEEILSDDFVTKVMHARRTPPEKKLSNAGALFEITTWHLSWAADLLCPHLPKEGRRNLVRKFLKIAKDFDGSDLEKP